MKRPWRHFFCAVLAVALTTAPLRAAEGEPAADTPAAETGAPAPDGGEAEARWREELNEAKRSKVRLRNAGVITSLAALGLLVAGNVRVASADDIEGCERDGSDIRCVTQDGADDANARLDQGRGLYVAGLLTGLVGVGLLVGSSKRSNKIDDLERTGRRRGYRLSLDAGRGDRLQLVLSREF